MNALLEAAKRERDKLQTELASNATYQRLQAVRRLIDTYEGIGGLPEEPSEPQNRFRQPSSRAREILEAAAKYLEAKRARATSGEILKHLLERGLSVGGKKPGSTLASYLSTSRFFNNVPAQGGYGLAVWGEQSPYNFEELPLETRIGAVLIPSQEKV